MYKELKKVRKKCFKCARYGTEYCPTISNCRASHFIIKACNSCKFSKYKDSKYICMKNNITVFHAYVCNRWQGIEPINNNKLKIKWVYIIIAAISIILVLWRCMR